MARFKITRYTHFFKVVSEDYDTYQNLIMRFVRKALSKYDFASWNRRADPKPPCTQYAASCYKRLEVRLHINTFEEFSNYLAAYGFSPGSYEIYDALCPIPANMDLEMREGWVPKEEQKPAIDYLTAPNGPKSRFIGIQTGKGKTVLACFDIAAKKTRTLIIVRPMYMQKWYDDVIEKMDITGNNVMFVSGGAEVKGLTNLCKDNQDALEDVKVIIMSNKTLQIWLKRYCENPLALIDEGYGFDPDEIYEKAGIGYRLIDEVHQDFHLNFTIDLFTNVECSLSLSATLLHNDKVTERMQKIAYPMENRYRGGAYDKYIAAHAVLYTLQDGRKFRTNEFGQTKYSHNAFEKSILRNPQFAKSYADMVKEITRTSYVQRRKPGEKCIIFASTKNMCAYLSSELRTAFPELNVKRYVAEDPYSNLMDSDIRVTTISSGGTAHDISNLITGILTVNIQSIQSVMQSFGRIRNINDSEKHFYYLACTNVRKHMDYHNDKCELMPQIAKTFVRHNYYKRV